MQPPTHAIATAAAATIVVFTAATKLAACMQDGQHRLQG